MIEVKRRVFSRIIPAILISVFGGCGQPVEKGTPDPYVTIFPEISESDSGWELKARIRNDYNWDVSIHDVELVAFSNDGEEVCRKHVGDLLQNEPASRSATVHCKSFPAIITVATKESPCDGANLDVVYWTGTDDQRGKHIDEDKIVWETTYQKCDEALPPKRVLRNVSQSN